ncbi:DUF5057 domain-containing protein [Paenibacillus sp. YPG26]|uniref:DUF5057 domain-containing protein n=1 Tax=Paenibacillus sp. YPG26 TaxID=2878915 RepID=UPI00203CC350|nr:DUF5057 domain-containing protein [Paenibacillus sp. YPG26]USB33679.1 DUF5057 domain-containing protein [Paenibacillus sp. YPG26]
MKNIRYLALFLILGFFLTIVLVRVNADNPAPYPLRILEIRDNTETSELTNVVRSLPGMDLNIRNVDTIRMKKFVALRDELDGKYDAIYIGSGAYSTNGVQTFTSLNSGQANAHNTTELMNDITMLKANAIVKEYVDKGLLVIVNNKVLEQKPQGNLYKVFYPYSTKAGARSNVIFVNSTDLTSTSGSPALAKKLADTPYAGMLTKRPRLKVNSKPIDYSADQTKVYTTGNKLTFTFDANNITDFRNRIINANLYIGVDSVLKMDENQLVASVPVTSASGNITYDLPKAYSGLLYWRLELVDQTSKLKSYETGTIQYQDEKTVVRVLQVMPSDNTNSSLLTTTNMNPEYLNNKNYSYNRGNYDIQIKNMRIDTFNSSGYMTLNGDYDMLIFGFRDEYNRYAAISSNAAAAVKKFISTGQAVMFTHDTIFEDPNSGNSNWRNWRDYFQTDTGQIAPKTNLGLGAPRSSEATRIVNDGLLTQYPFYLSKSGASSPSVNVTHNQYFTLNLEDESIVPWYNIAGGTRDEQDSWNHYYTYSKGNVTYSGTGHDNTGFPEWEQKLFVNTMYRAFIGSNHAPVITVHSPVANAIIPSYQNLVVSYTVNDWDLKDRNLTTGFRFKFSDGTEKVMMPEQTVHTGNVVNMTFDNPLPQGGDMSVEITARDKQGAIVKQSVPVKIQKITANLQTDRTISANVVNGKVAKNDPVTLRYTITPKQIPYYAEKNPIQISGIRFNEVLPPNLQIANIAMSTAAGTVVQSGSLESGYTLTGTLNPITYRLSSDKKFYIADPVVFDITVIPTKNGVYSLTNSVLTFTDIGAKQPTTLPFQNYVFEAVTWLTKLSLPDATLIVGDTLPLIAKYEPEDATNKDFNWISDKPGVVSVDPVTGIINAISVGEARITVKATDGSGVTGTAIVKVIQPDLIISGLNTVRKGEQIELIASLPLVNQKVNLITWDPKESGYIDVVDSSDFYKKMVTGQKSGTVTIVVTATTENESTHVIRTYTKEYQVTVINPLQGINITGGDQVEVGSSINLGVKLNPLDADDLDKLIYQWEVTDSTGGTLASLSTTDSQTTSLTGLKPGTVIVTVSAGGKSSSKEITIMPKPLKALALPEEISMKVGKMHNLMEDLSILTPGLTPEDKSSLIWTVVSFENAVRILGPDTGPGAGIIAALREGRAVVKVAYRENPNVSDSTTIIVSKDSNEDRY